MEINQVRFGNYTIGNSAPRNQNREQQPAEETAVQVSGENTKSVDRDDLLNAMDLVGLQNKPQVGSAGVKDVNPADFLSGDRISDIEAMMAEFESGVGAIEQVIMEEFPELSEAETKALAARIFAQE